MNELHSVCRFAPTVSGADWCRQRVDRVGVLFQLNWQTADCGRTSVGRMWALSMRVYVGKVSMCASASVWIGTCFPLCNFFANYFEYTSLSGCGCFGV